MSGGRFGEISYPCAQAGLMEAGESDICFHGKSRPVYEEPQILDKAITEESDTDEKGGERITVQK